MPDAVQIESPECERMCAVAPYSQKIGEFLEWVRDTHGAFLAVPHEHSEGCEDEDGDRMCGLHREELCYFGKSIPDLLAEFFEIDMDKVESERRAILAALQKGGKG